MNVLLLTVIWIPLFLAPSSASEEQWKGRRGAGAAACRQGGEVITPVANTPGGLMQGSSSAMCVQSLPARCRGGAAKNPSGRSPGVALDKFLHSEFWSKGVLQVHDNYLQLFWEITKVAFKLLVPISLILTVAFLTAPTATATFKDFAELWLYKLQQWVSHATLLPLFVFCKIRGINISFGDYNQSFEDAGLPIWLAILTRPIVDSLLFQVAVGSLWDKCATLFGKTLPSERSRTPEDALRWTLLSSLLYALSHLGTSLPAPSPELLQEGVTNALQTGELSVFGMSLYREEWNERLVETLLSTQPLMKTVGQGIVNGILSWGLLCPLYQLNGAMASIGAELTWLLFGSTHVDTQILLRIFARIFLPWSTSKSTTTPSSRRVGLVARPLMDSLLFRWGIHSIWEWWLRRHARQASPTRPSWMIWSSVLFALSHFQSTGGLWGCWGKNPFRVVGAGGSDTGIWWNSNLNRRLVKLLVNGLWSWGLLCPLYQSHGLWASTGAQMVLWNGVRWILPLWRQLLRGGQQAVTNDDGESNENESTEVMTRAMEEQHAVTDDEYESNENDSIAGVTRTIDEPFCDQQL